MHPTSHVPRQMPPNRWVGSTYGGICPSLRSGVPEGVILQSFRAKSRLAASPSAESEIPPASEQAAPFLKGALGRQTCHSIQFKKAPLEPSTKSSGGPGCRAPRSPALRRTAHSFTRGRAEAWSRPRNQWRAKPEPPCAACRLRGGPGPWSIFGHFLLIKKVATWGQADA